MCPFVSILSVYSKWDDIKIFTVSHCENIACIYVSTSYIGLIESSMVMQEGRFEFGNGEDRPPTSFRWKGDVIQLENKIVPDRHRN